MIDYSRHYSHWHQDTPEHAAKEAAGCVRYLELLDLPRSNQVLDIGCGMGFFLLAAQQYGFASVTGIDQSPQQVSAATRRGVNAELVDDTPLWLEQRVAAFDAIFMFDVLEHIPVDQQIGSLARIHGALRPGGCLFIRVPNASSAFAGRMRWGDWTHTSAFSEHSLDFVLYNAGFRDIVVRDDHFGRLPIWVPRLGRQGFLRGIHYGLRRLQAIAEFGTGEGGKMPLTLNILAVARKAHATA